MRQRHWRLQGKQITSSSFSTLLSFIDINRAELQSCDFSSTCLYSANRAFLPAPEQLPLMSSFVPCYLGEFASSEMVLEPWDWNTFVLESCQILLEEIESMTRGSETDPQMPGGRMVNLYSRFSFASSRYPPDRMEGLFCLVTEAIHYLNFVLRTIKASPTPVADKFYIITSWTDKFLKNEMRDPIEVRTPISTLSPFPPRPMS
jgi:hypothetical protein